MKLLRVVTTAGVAVCISISGCGQSEGAPDEQVSETAGSNSADSVDGDEAEIVEPILITANHRGEGAEEVGIEGTAMIVDGCVTIGSGTVVIWAQGSHWDHDTQSIVRPSGQTLSLGGAVTLNGLSWTYDDAVLWLDESGLEDLEGCYSDGATIVIDQ